MSYLLDTTWSVEYLRGNVQVVRRVQELLPEGLAVSIISVAELYEGVFRSRQRSANEMALRGFLGGVSVLGITDETARIYGQLKADLRNKGIVIGVLDLLIAATALNHGLGLLSLDTDFERLEGLTVLRS